MLTGLEGRVNSGGGSSSQTLRVLQRFPFGLIRSERGTEKVNVDLDPVRCFVACAVARMASLVRVGDERMWLELNRRPPVGAILDVGFPVLVTASKQVAGGGMLITAEPIGEHDGR